MFEFMWLFKDVPITGDFYVCVTAASTVCVTEFDAQYLALTWEKKNKNKNGHNWNKQQQKKLT